MTIVTDEQLTDPFVSHFIQVKPNDPCFLCGDVLKIPYLYWMGSPSGIGLHLDCAINFANKLVADVTAGGIGVTSEKGQILGHQD